MEFFALMLVLLSVKSIFCKGNNNCTTPSDEQEHFGKGKCQHRVSSKENQESCYNAANANENFKVFTVSCKYSVNGDSYLEVSWSNDQYNVWFYTLEVTDNTNCKQECYQFRKNVSKVNFPKDLKGLTYSETRIYTFKILANPVKEQGGQDVIFKEVKSKSCRKVHTTARTPPPSSLSRKTDNWSNAQTPPILPSQNVKKGDDNENENNGSLPDIIIIISVVALIVIIGAFGIFLVMLKRRKTSMNINRPIEQGNVYISHCSVKERDKNRLLNFIGLLSKFGITINADIFHQIDIDTSGGPGMWIPRTVESAETIIMIITPSYLKALQPTNPGFEKHGEVRKTVAEYRHIVNRFYTSGFSSIILLVDSHVKLKDIPPEIKCFTQLNYNKCLDSKDHSINRLAGLIEKVEPIQMESAETTHV